MKATDIKLGYVAKRNWSNGSDDFEVWYVVLARTAPRRQGWTAVCVKNDHATDRVGSAATWLSTSEILRWAYAYEWKKIHEERS